MGVRVRLLPRMQLLRGLRLQLRLQLCGLHVLRLLLRQVCRLPPARANKVMPCCWWVLKSSKIEWQCCRL